MKKNLFLLLIFTVLGTYLQAQVPEAGNLIGVHKVTTAEMNSVTGQDTGVLIYNLDSSRLYFFDGTSWKAAGGVTADTSNGSIDSARVRADSTFIYQKGNTVVTENAPRVFMGTFAISSTGSQSISGLPFKPSLVKFVAYANVDYDTLDADNGVWNNYSGLENSFGYMTGFAQIYNGTVTQQVICGGGSGNSINDISRFASTNNCIGIRYGDQNGTNLGVTMDNMLSFDAPGFTINLSSHVGALQVIYTADRLTH